MSPLMFVDTEATGLDWSIHQPYEVCLWEEHWAEPKTFDLRHSLEGADPAALKIGGYFERGAHGIDEGSITKGALAKMLNGVTLVGSNPAFDAAMLRRFIGAATWHHRMIDVSNLAMVVLGLPRPPGLAATVHLLREAHYSIPDPDHTSEGDVRVTRAVYEALMSGRLSNA